MGLTSPLLSLPVEAVDRRIPTCKTHLQAESGTCEAQGSHTLGVLPRGFSDAVRPLQRRTEYSRVSMAVHHRCQKTKTDRALVVQACQPLSKQSTGEFPRVKRTCRPRAALAKHKAEYSRVSMAVHHRCQKTKTDRALVRCRYRTEASWQSRRKGECSPWKRRPDKGPCKHVSLCRSSRQENSHVSSPLSTAPQ
jgi:hypothetical protein